MTNNFTSKGLTGFVILVESLLDDEPIGNAEMAKFALEAASKYNGDASCMKDVVILISLGDRRSYIEPNRNVGISAETLVDVVCEFFFDFREIQYLQKLFL